MRDEFRNEPIILMPSKLANRGDENKYFYVNGNIKEGYRGTFSNQCKSQIRNYGGSRTEIFRLVKEANAQSASVFRDGNSPIKAGWAYVGMIYEHYWTERYFDVDVTKAGENATGEMQYSFPQKPKIKALGNVNLRENHIQFIDAKWVNQNKIGVICKGDEINIVKLKRVALVADDSDGYEFKKFDGFWWAKVEGRIGWNCE